MDRAYRSVQPAIMPALAMCTLNTPGLNGDLFV